jgi:hypothetical protein
MKITSHATMTFETAMVPTVPLPLLTVQSVVVPPFGCVNTVTE